ncbi:MAG TPA: hypothetical protein VJ981_01205 [Gammaproteobacteria bacterium]|nr:hypothetical protein [Gammaproteobacteria bacterium]
MSTKIVPKMTGIALAMAAAGLMAGCAGNQTGSSTVAASGETADMVHCYGVNNCKGHNDCKSASNSCAGQASCKGSGFVAMPSRACSNVGGEVKDEWSGSVSKTDLIHCYGVNKCKGHNDCATANNSCAGQASCKGQGFVATTAKSCGNVGGKSGA